MDNYGFLKVAAAIPALRVADCDFNAEHIITLTEQAAQRGVEIIAFPELAVTGSTAGDLFLHSTLLDAAEEALDTIAAATRKLPITLIVGAPLRQGNALYNTAVVLSQGRILGVVPKSVIPARGEGQQSRWFRQASCGGEEQILVAGNAVDFGEELTFDINGVEFGVELSADLHTPSPRSTQMALGGAKVIFHLAAECDIVGKHNRLHRQIAAHSERLLAACVFTSAGFGESTTDLSFSGAGMVYECGELLRETERFSINERMAVADVDIERIEFLRRNSPTFNTSETQEENTVIDMEVPEALKASALDRTINPMPFVPQEEKALWERCNEVFHIQSFGLAKRLRHTGCKRAVIGISGGLDSTLALLVTARTFDLLGEERSGIIGITMPGFGTTDRTYNNALELMRRLGVTLREIPIREACTGHMKDIGLAPDDRSAAYENAQARERTQILMDVANKEGGMVIGTGDLSELALGWATYNGDQMSMYGVNASVPKTLVRHIVKWVAHTEQDATTRAILLDVVDTPVSPELLPADNEGKIAQKTEDLVGPYELHDFFLYNFIANGYSPAKLFFLAQNAFHGSYDDATLLKWLKTFFRRFFSQQFKRSASPDGVKVGSVSLSPRGDWMMPSDAAAAMWLRELETL